MSQVFGWSRWAVLALTVVVVGCSPPKDPSKKETIPVKGEVSVDGAPVAGVLVQLHATADVSAGKASVTMGSTNDKGLFAITTYSEGDGVPAGDYVATFTWPVLQLNQAAEAPDRLKNRYKDPSKSTFKVSVAAGSPVDMGKIELTTK